MNTATLFSSASEEWETPQPLYDRLDAEFRFGLDVAATNANHKAPTWYTREMDGLSLPWRSVVPDRPAVWCNPPYGRGVGAWVSYGWQQAIEHRNTVVLLLPARTDTAWFHDYATLGDLVFLRGRLRFGRAQNGAPFPSLLVVFGPNPFCPEYRASVSVEGYAWNQNWIER